MSDWIEWKGGECPVPKDTLVAVRLVHKETGEEWERAGFEEAGHFDGLNWWNGCGRRYRITAYRIVKDASDE